MEIKEWHLTRENLSHLHDKLSKTDFSKRWVVQCREAKTKRTSDSNRRLWAIYNQIALHTGEHPDKIHELMKWKFLRYQETVNGETIEAVVRIL